MHDDQNDCGRGDRIEVADRVLAAGFTTCPNLILRDGRLSAAARLVYGVLLSYAWQSNQCFPSLTRLAADLGMSDRNVRRYLRQLMDAGLLSMRQRGLHRTNLYTIHLPETSAVTVPPPPADDSESMRRSPDKDVRSSLSRAGAARTRPSGLDRTRMSDKEDSGAKKTQDVKPPPRDRSTTQAPPDGGAVEAPALPENVVPLSTATRTRKPDLIWEAMISVWGYAPANDGERGPWNKAGFHFRRAGVTPEEIATLADRYRHKYPTAACTPLAVSTKVGELRAYTAPSSPNGRVNGAAGGAKAKSKLDVIRAGLGLDTVSDRGEGDHDRGGAGAGAGHAAADVAASRARRGDGGHAPLALR